MVLPWRNKCVRGVESQEVLNATAAAQIKENEEFYGTRSCTTSGILTRSTLISKKEKSL